MEIQTGIRLLVVLALLAPPLAAVPSPPEAEEARRLLAAAVAALGGIESIEARRTWLLEGSGRENLSAEMQGMAPDNPTWREHEETVAVDAAALSVAWQRRTPRNDHSLRWRRMIYGADTTGFVDLSSGRGMLHAGGAPEARRRALARRVPHLLLAEAAGQDTELALPAAAQGADPGVVRFDTAEGDTLLLSLAGDPLRLVAVEYRVDLPGRGDVPVRWEWPRWQAHPVLGAAPDGHRVLIGGELFQEVAYGRYEAAVSVDDLLGVPASDDATHGEHDMPAAADPIPAADGFPATGEVAPGVHVGSIRGFGVLLIEMDDHVVVVEAPALHPGFESIPATTPGADIAAEQLAWIEGTAAGKPVGAVVVSHHHSDHLGGARVLVRNGAELLMPAGDVESVRSWVAAGEIAAPVTGVADTHVLGDAGRTIEVIAVGTNPHTAESLLVWLPEERIAFQGDLFYFTADTPLPAGRATMNRFFAGWLEARGLQPRAVYGVHGSGAAGPQALRAVLGDTGSRGQ